MALPATYLNDLIGSRICHDLISPIGAISNGVELIAMSGDISGPEMSLISDSVENANARIRFFRIAFGLAGAGQMVAHSEITGILRDMTRGGRLVIDWQPREDLLRQRVKLAFLLLQCFETAMPWGGRVTVTSVAGQWAIHGEGDQVRIEPELWALLHRARTETPLQAANVHFALAGLNAKDTGRSLELESSPSSARVRF
jgi:histidine phosphotransferase ChpT